MPLDPAYKAGLARHETGQLLNNRAQAFNSLPVTIQDSYLKNAISEYTPPLPAGGED